jgi:hypothetical protein
MPACPTVSVLAPGENSTCEVQLAVDHADFDNEEADATPLTLDVTAAGTSNVTSAPLTIPTTATSFTGLRLPINRSLEAEASLSPTEASAAGKNAFLQLLRDAMALLVLMQLCHACLYATPSLCSAEAKDGSTYLAVLRLLSP